MSIRNYVDNAAAKTVPAGCNSSTTSIIVNSTASLPTVPFTATLDRATASAEQILVTGAVGTTLTVTRNHGGTGAFSHAAGCAFEHTVDAIDMREANTHVNATSGAHGVTGNFVGDNDTQTLTNKTLDNATLGDVSLTGFASVSDIVDATVDGAIIRGNLRVPSGYANAAAADVALAARPDGVKEGDIVYIGPNATAGKSLGGLYSPLSSAPGHLYPAAVSSGLVAIAAGTVSITPVANTPTSGAVTFPASRFANTPVVVVTIDGTVPGTVITGCGVSGVSTSGCTIWVTRTNTTATTLSWVAVDSL